MDLLYQRMQTWGVDGIQHDPIHPHLAPDTKTFADSHNIGTVLEELTAHRLDTLFEARNSYCDRTTTDLDGRLRAKGKRIRIQQHYYIAPDYQLSTGGEWYWVDLKSKQFHSYYHTTEQLQQCVNISEVTQYLTIGAYPLTRAPVLLLFHLWPSALMQQYGHGATARIHTGLRWKLLTDTHKARLLRQYPVDDWYYLINAKKVERLGRKGRMQGTGDEDSAQGAEVYYFDLRHAIKGPAQGTLPPLKDWAYAAHRDL